MSGSMGVGSHGREQAMTIWIDPPAWPAHGRSWSHLISDASYDELQTFAAQAGIQLLRHVEVVAVEPACRYAGPRREGVQLVIRRIADQV